MSEATRFVLVDASHPGNVGAAARALRVMGFDDLVLVRPRVAELAQHPQARALASGALDVLARARVVATLAEALEGITWACATAMTPRDFGPPTHAPRAHLPALAARGERVAFVFGGERCGLANEDVWRCHACLSIPTAPGYGSLNLAQAVQLLAYEWRQALGGFGPGATPPAGERADAAALHGLLGHWQQVLVEIGFLDPAAPKKLLPRLTRLLLRARPTVEEVHILRGIARAMQAPRPPQPPREQAHAPGHTLSGPPPPPPPAAPCSADCERTSTASSSATPPPARAGRC
jgi:tRNA/rRNA methyltransferase